MNECLRTATGGVSQDLPPLPHIEKSKLGKGVGNRGARAVLLSSDI